MSEIDFSNASLDDFKFASDQNNTTSGAEEATQAETTPEQVQPTPEATPEATQEVAPTPEATPEPTPQGYKFKDDFIKGVVEFYEKTGDITPYLQAKTVDFTKMSDEEVMRRSLREQYSELSDKAFDRLYQQEVINKFKLDADEYGEEDSELGRELLRVEASKIRNQYLDWQKSFQAPEPTEALQADTQAIDALKKFEEEVRKSPLTQSILNDKKISIKVGESEFNYELQNAESLLNMTIDNDQFFNQFATPEGSVDYAKWYKTAAYSQNPELFEKTLINLGKTLGREEVTKEIKNPSTASGGDIPTESTGDFKTGLLQAFVSRGISK